MIDSIGRPGWIFFALGVFVLSLIAGFLYFQGVELWLVAASWAAIVLIYLANVEAARRSAKKQAQAASHVQARLQTIQELFETLTQLAAQTGRHDLETEYCKTVTARLQQILQLDSVELTLADASTGGQVLYRSTPSGTTSLLMAAEQQAQEFDPGGAGLPPYRYTIPINSHDAGSFLRAAHSQAPLPAEELRLLQGAAGLLDSYLKSNRLQASIKKEQEASQARQNELQMSEHALQLFLQLSEVGADFGDFAAMLQTLADRLGKFFQPEGVLIFQYDASHKQLRPMAACGPLRHQFRSLLLDPTDIPFAYAVIESGKPLAINDPNRSVYIRARAAAQLQCRSLLALPLLVNRQAIGILALAYQASRSFNDQETKIALEAAQQVAMAIARAQSLQAERRRAQELGALQKATTILMSTLELEGLLGQIMDAALSALPAAQRGALHLIARDTGQLQLRAVQGYKDPRIRMLSLTAGSSHAARAVHERRPILVEDAQADPGISPHDIPELNDAGSSIIAPLLLGDESLGAISLDSFHRYAFTTDDLNLLVSFAATASTALKNAQLHGEVQRQAITDTLTGLYNRRGFYELGRREVERALRFNRHLTALMLDLDYFKEVNDRYGHHFGDKVLIGITQRWTQELRQIDLIGRYGGDEFIALLPETDLESANQVGERLRRTVAGMTFPIGPQVVRITMSVGAAGLDEGCKDLDALVQKADRAMYEAKHGGRNQVVAG